MQNLIIEYIFLVVIILILVMVANKLRLAYPIILVIGGLVLSLTSRFSDITIDPEMVFFIFLPPLLYEAAWHVSWKEFWKWRRVIFSFAFPIVVITSFVIALVSNWLIPGFTLALGFLLGGIISPPDAISSSTIMRHQKVPRSLVSIAEGESLFNDASSLIVFRFALAAIITGQFQVHQAAVSFFLVIVMGILIGLLVGLIFYGFHRWLPTTPSIEIVLTLITPYCMYYLAEHFHFSGVLAVVSGGLFLSSKRQTILTYQSRIQGINVWTILSFVLNGFVFLLIGLQLPSIIGQLGDISLGKAIVYGLIISLALIITRLICTLGASVFTRIMSNFITVAESNPGWRAPVVLGWAGMRGVVSLAAALAIPLLISEGHPFPYRNLILFITFMVILVTLVFQGLTLPWVIRKVKPGNNFRSVTEHDQEIQIQRKIAQSSIRFLEENYGDERFSNEHVNIMFEKLKTDLNFFNQEFEEITNTRGNSMKSYQTIYLELLQHQRELLNKMNTSVDCNEELIRKYFSLVDLEEYKIRENLLKEKGGNH